MYFYPSFYIVGVWLFENDPPTSLRETFQGAQRFMLLKKNFKKMEANCHVLKSDPLGYKLWDTPRGKFWFPSSNNTSLIPFILSEQETGIYGYNIETSVKPGDIVLDCGAHVRVFIREALRLGAKKVIAIEPARDNIECIKRNFKKEIEDGRVVVCPKGVWDKEGLLPFYTNPQNSGSDSFVYHNQRLTPSYFAPLTTIDKITTELKLPQIDFIKMDIEGAVIKALLGGKKTLSSFAPRLAIATEEEGKPINIIRTVQGIRSDYRINYGAVSIDNLSISFDELIFTKGASNNK